MGVPPPLPAVAPAPAPPFQGLPPPLLAKPSSALPGVPAGHHAAATARQRRHCRGAETGASGGKDGEGLGSQEEPRPRTPQPQNSYAPTGSRLCQAFASLPHPQGWWDMPARGRAGGVGDAAGEGGGGGAAAPEQLRHIRCAARASRPQPLHGLVGTNV